MSTTVKSSELEFVGQGGLNDLIVQIRVYRLSCRNRASLKVSKTVRLAEMVGVGQGVRTGPIS